VALRLAVISDIHANMDAFTSVIDDLPSHDALLCLGDLVGYGPEPNEVVEELQAMRPEYVLMGNHDYAVVTGDTSGFSRNAAVAIEWTRQRIKEENSHYLSTLRPSMKLEAGGIRISAFHGSPREPLTEYILPDISPNIARQIIREGDSEIVLLGHTHIPMAHSFERKILANPGSVGQPRDGDARASYGLLTLDDSKLSFQVRRVTYPVDAVARKILNAGLPKFLAERLYIGM
jgi:putative phosphoesterase